VAKVRERLVVNKQRSHRFVMESSNLKKLNDVEGKKQCRVKVSIGGKASGKETTRKVRSGWITLRRIMER
jgi:hypothetical protein